MAIQDTRDWTETYPISPVHPLGQIEYLDVPLIGVYILLFCIATISVFAFSIWLNRKPDSLCPDTSLPLRRGYELPYESRVKVLSFLYSMFEYDNRIFAFKKAAYCRQTGRIYQNAITWYGKISIDWTFLQKRHPGRYVSWGSLTSEQQEMIRLSHDSIDKFQTDISSPNPSPSMLDPEYAYTKPGPLYVDIQTNTLLGWQCVPDTELEVLIVQKPIQRHD